MSPSLLTKVLTLPTIPHLPSSAMPPPRLLPLGPFILPARSGLVCAEWMAIRTQRVSWKVCACVRVCCVQKQGGTDSCGLWAVRGFCVRVGLQEEEQHPAKPPLLPPTKQPGRPARCVHSRPDRLQILQGINNSQQRCEGCRQRKQRGRARV